MRVFGYCRVSTSVQAEEGYSLDEQRGRIEAYCKAMNWTLLKVFVDAGESGANKDRPALQEMISQISQAEKVVVYKLDRLSRSQKDTLYLIEDVFLKNGVDFVSMTENFDTSTPFGKAIVGILSVFAQLEREQIRERMVMGRIARSKEGKYCGQARTAIGYEYKDGKLEIIPAEAEQVRIVFDLLLANKSFGSIAREMNKRGYSHHYGAWNKYNIKSIATNPVYIGKVSFGGQLFDGLHEPIVSEEIFEQAQRIAEKRTEDYSAQKNPGRATSLLSGMLVCGKCGEPLWKMTDKRVHSFYCCNGRIMRRGDEKCKNKRWRMEELDEVVLNEVRKLSLRPPPSEPEKKVDNSAEIAKINTQLSRLIDLYTLGNYDLETLNKKTDELNRRKLALLETKQKEAHPVMIRSFDDIFARGDLQEVRAVLFSLIDKIVVNDDEIDIHWRF